MKVKRKIVKELNKICFNPNFHMHWILQIQAPIRAALDFVELHNISGPKRQSQIAETVREQEQLAKTIGVPIGAQNFRFYSKLKIEGKKI